MAQFEVIMPKMGESVQEATIVKWFKKVNDMVEEEDAIVEIATDKVDTEIPSPVDGKIIKLLYNEGDVVPVGKPIAVIATEGEEVAEVKTATPEAETAKVETKEEVKEVTLEPKAEDGRFYSPLVRSIAKEEGISNAELSKVEGTGQNGRVTKNDILAHVENRSKAPAQEPQLQAKPQTEAPKTTTTQVATPAIKTPKIVVNEGDEVVPMDRMRKLIAEHMVMSVQVSPHVTSVVEADVTNMVT